jgi:endonuclease-3
VRGGAVIEESTARSTADRLAEKVPRSSNHGGPVEALSLPPVPDWKPSDRRRLRRILELLRSEYGRPVLDPHEAPIDELVLTVLSQNTNDRNRDVAYGRLRERFDSWAEVRDAPTEDVEDAIRPGGLAPTKAGRIQRILEAIGDDDLTWLGRAPVAEGREYLCDLPGVGRKTAACVLLFSYGRHDVPVDTHVYRVGTRLGLFRPGGSLEEAHDELLRLTTPEEAYEAHVLLIRHGRRTCTARAPRCEECPLLRTCPYGRERVRA